MQWMTPMAVPPLVVHAWSNTAWHAPRTRHRLEGLWQLHVYQHRGRLDAETPRGALHADLAPGMVTLLPPGAASGYDVPGRAHFSCLHLRLGDGGEARLAATAAGDPLLAGLVQAAADAALAESGPAASALAWAALWRLAVRPMADPVAAACAWIDARLEDPPTVAELARRSGLSGAHLRRLFRASLGVGVKPWIQRRRAERARHLLLHSDRSPREIAAELGIGDAQRFNKLLRRQFGRPPSRLRSG